MNESSTEPHSSRCPRRSTASTSTAAAVHGSRDTRAESRANFSIWPGRSVGPFCLGMSIGAALVETSQVEDFPQVVADLEEPFELDTVLQLPSLGLSLCFDGFSQRLHLIIVHFPNPRLSESNVHTSSRTSKGGCVKQSQSCTPRVPGELPHTIVLSAQRSVMTFSYQNGELLLWNPRIVPDLRHIYRICGPTIPGCLARQPEPDDSASLNAPSLNLRNSAEQSDTRGKAGPSTRSAPNTTSSPIGAAGSSDRSASMRLPSLRNHCYYYLKYPGLVFRFPLAEDDFQALHKSCRNSTTGDLEDLPFCLPRSRAAPLLDRLFVLWSQPTPSLEATLPWCKFVKPNQDKMSLAAAETAAVTVIGRDASEPSPEAKEPESLDIRDKSDRTNTTQVQSEKVLQFQASGSAQVIAILGHGVGFKSGDNLCFGAHLQDIYTRFGTPDRISIKQLDIANILLHTARDPSHKMGRIGAQSTAEAFDRVTSWQGFPTAQTSAAPDYFCNYFNLGIDFLLCGLSHRVKKFVLHTNIPGHCLFGEYRRCFFSLKVPESYRRPTSGSGERSPSTSSNGQGPEIKGNRASVKKRQGSNDGAQYIHNNTPWADVLAILGQPSPPLLVAEAAGNHRQATLHSDDTGEYTEVDWEDAGCKSHSRSPTAATVSDPSEESDGLKGLETPPGNGVPNNPDSIDLKINNVSQRVASFALRPLDCASATDEPATRKFYGFPGIAIEVFANKWIASITLF